MRPIGEAEKLSYAIQRWEWAYDPELQRPEGLPDFFVNLVLAGYAGKMLSTAEAAEHPEMVRKDFTGLLLGLERRATPLSSEDEFEDAEISVG
ncbi:hypothetical protein [Deinococcus frigens]|uniref:hypothetical protein n=1 Tax=Deinococcus frigens TaxID=249403 RepID=UPI0004985691|nr:hypothetical protein [Deinococcus frigens]